MLKSSARYYPGQKDFNKINEKTRPGVIITENDKALIARQQNRIEKQLMEV